MNDPRKIRQTIQAYAAILLAAAAPSLLATPFDWRVLVSSLIATITALLTNPRLVVGVSSRMPEAGSSAVLPVQTLVQNPTAPVLGVVSTGVDRSEDITGVAKPRIAPPVKPPTDPTA
jgi:hypothetical protein